MHTFLFFISLLEAVPADENLEKYSYYKEVELCNIKILDCVYDLFNEDDEYKKLKNHFRVKVLKGDAEAKYLLEKIQDGYVIHKFFLNGQNKLLREITKEQDCSIAYKETEKWVLCYDRVTSDVLYYENYFFNESNSLIKLERYDKDFKPINGFN